MLLIITFSIHRVITGKDEPELLVSLHELRHHVLHGQRPMHRRCGRRGEEEALGVGARLEHPACCVPLHRELIANIRLTAH